MEPEQGLGVLNCFTITTWGAGAVPAEENNLSGLHALACRAAVEAVVETGGWFIGTEVHEKGDVTGKASIASKLSTVKVVYGNAETVGLDDVCKGWFTDIGVKMIEYNWSAAVVFVVGPLIPTDE